MRHQMIQPGMSLCLTSEAKERYGLDGVYVVDHLKAKPGYTTPYVFVRSHRPEGGLLAFMPKDLAKVDA